MERLTTFTCCKHSPTGSSSWLIFWRRRFLKQFIFQSTVRCKILNSGSASLNWIFIRTLFAAPLITSIWTFKLQTKADTLLTFHQPMHLLDTRFAPAIIDACYCYCFMISVSLLLIILLVCCCIFIAFAWHSISTSHYCCFLLKLKWNMQIWS